MVSSAFSVRIDVQSDGPSQALVLAERLVDNERLNADCVEVMHLAGGHHEFAHPSSHSPEPIKLTRNRVAP
ncbi:hypothetical protein [Bradyrhizobium sp. URHC0002]